METQQQQQESCVPPGFRFHPTEEELVAYYLTRKVASQKIDLDIIQEVDLYRIEPWDLQERCRYGGDEQTTEWYFFSFKDRKYPSGTRTNRATTAGFWKATGRDKPVLSTSRPSSMSPSRVIGMRKTLVFYKGRAPHGCKSDWIMHEYRLKTNEHAPTQEEGWVVCRAFQKPVPNQNQMRPPPFVFPHSCYGAAAPGGGGYYDVLPRLHVHGGDQGHYSAAGGMSASFFPGPVQYYSGGDQDQMESKKPSPYLLSIPQLESPRTGDDAAGTAGCLVAQNQDGIHQLQQGQAAAAATAIDWNFLDTLLSTSQLHDESTLYLQ